MSGTTAHLTTLVGTRKGRCAVCRATGTQWEAFYSDGTSDVRCVEHTPSWPHVVCWECGEEHEAVFSHLSQWGEGGRPGERVYAVVCPVDDLTDYYTDEVVF